MRRLTYLLDTDWVISYLNGYRPIVERVEALQDEAGLAMSILSLGEVYEGVYSSTDPVRSERGLRDFLFLPSSQPVAPGRPQSDPRGAAARGNVGTVWDDARGLRRPLLG